MKTLLILTVLSFSQIVLAGTGHFHPTQIVKCSAECTQEDATGVAAKSLDYLIQKGKVPSSWSAIPLEKVEKKQFKKGPEWVLTFVDKTQPANKQRLFVFITMKGWLSGSNYTGE